MSNTATFQAGAYLHHLDSITPQDLAWMNSEELRLILSITGADMTDVQSWRKVGTATVTVELGNGTANSAAAHHQFFKPSTEHPFFNPNAGKSSTACDDQWASHD